ncbi:MAG: PAS domain-containing protein, partial [Humidesulfovibrio sp.]|nr:PAS domain-containing protein [Humidesulfovibrio sp.]
MGPSQSNPPEARQKPAPASPVYMPLEAYQTFLEDCPEPMQITDALGVIRAVNRAFCEEAGHPREALLGSNVQAFGFYVDLRQRDQLFVLLKSQGRVREFGVRLRTQKLGEFAALVSASLIVVGGETLVMSSIRNVSEMSAAQEALRKSEELLRSAFQASLDPITLSRTNGEFVEVNDAFCEQSGYSRAEVLGRTAR